METSPVSERASVAERHYRKLAPRYDDFLRWSPAFLATHAEAMVDHLHLEPDDQLVDLACGTGMYSLALLDRVPLQKPVIGVDPSGEMLDRLPEDARITPEQSDAVSFSRRPGTYDKVLLKEAVHHVDDQQELFDNLHARLRPGGRLLLVHVDPDRVDYPLFDEARRRCRWWFSHPDDLEERLRAAGFGVERDLLVHRHRVPRDRYHEIVAGRYMSVLTSFDDGEVEAGLEEMRHRHRDMPVLEFDETFDYVLALRG